jgi:hypothetical protein
MERYVAARAQEHELEKELLAEVCGVLKWDPKDPISWPVSDLRLAFEGRDLFIGSESDDALFVPSVEQRHRLKALGVHTIWLAACGHERLIGLVPKDEEGTDG